MSMQPTSRRRAVVLAAVLATLAPGLALAQAKLKVAGIYTVPSFLASMSWSGDFSLAAVEALMRAPRRSGSPPRQE